MNVTLAIGHRSAPVKVSHPTAGADLRAALTGTTPPDDAFVRSIAEAMSMVTSEVVDPWADA
jgi:hypothetical protein